jgi:hypothetical protein
MGWTRSLHDDDVQDASLVINFGLCFIDLILEQLSLLSKVGVSMFYRFNTRAVIIIFLILYYSFKIRSIFI